MDYLVLGAFALGGAIAIAQEIYDWRLDRKFDKIFEEHTRTYNNLSKLLDDKNTKIRLK